MLYGYSNISDNFINILELQNSEFESNYAMSGTAITFNLFDDSAEDIQLYILNLVYLVIILQLIMVVHRI